MKKETVHEHARRIHELASRVDEISRSEGRALEEYSARELVAEAHDILDLMEDWVSEAHYSQTEKRRQVQLLRNFIKKWEATK
jgi:hypothetical protein